MKPYQFNRRRPVLFMLLILGASLYSCSKTNNLTTDPVIPPPIPPVTGSDTMTFSFTPAYPDFWNYMDNQYELIVSTTAGEILFDSVMQTRITVPVTIRTTEKLVDLITIARFQDTAVNNYEVNMYKGVNPSQWDNLYFFYGYTPAPVKLATPIAQLKLHYKNVPATHNETYWFANGASLIGLQAGTSGEIVRDYPKYPGVPSFILFPTLGLYKIYDQVNAEDTVDLANIDTVTRLKVNYPASYTKSYVEVMGFTDTTDFYKNEIVFGLMDWIYDEYDILYPRNPIFQRYQLQFNLRGPDNDHTQHFSYADTVASDIKFYGSANYEVSSALTDNFTVRFKDVRPTWYEVSLSSGKIAFAIFSSPDSTTINPLMMANMLKAHSHLLGGTNFDDLHIGGFSFETIEGLDYTSHNNYTFNSRLRTRRMINSADRYSKSY